MDKFEYRCPVHGVVVWHRRSDPNPPEIPARCPIRYAEEGEPCGRRLRFQISAHSGAADDGD